MSMNQRSRGIVALSSLGAVMFVCAMFLVNGCSGRQIRDRIVVKPEQPVIEAKAKALRYPVSLDGKYYLPGSKQEVSFQEHIEYQLDLKRIDESLSEE